LSPGQTSFHGVFIVVTIFAPELTLARIFVVTRDQATGHTLSIGFAKQPLVFEIALARGSDLLSVLLPPELVDLCMQGEEYGRTERPRFVREPKMLAGGTLVSTTTRRKAPN